jgi:Alpha 1,4-glycosyltransferase conserved region
MNFDGSSWPSNGPDAVTRVLKKICRTSGTNITDDCEHFNLLPISQCYAIAWEEAKKLFTADYAEEVEMRTRDSHFVHLWNKVSWSYRVRVESESAIISLAQSYCPRVLSSLDEYF